MKKLLAIFLAVMLLLSMAACTSNGDRTADGQEKFVIGVCQLVPHEALDAATKGFVDRVTEVLGEENVEFLDNGNPACPHCVDEEKKKDEQI